MMEDMNNNKRRLLKDLPFDHCIKGTVIYKASRGHGGNYSISNKTTFYETGGSSSNGLWAFEKNQEEIIDLIWDNEKWFEDADLKHIDFITTPTSVTLRFSSIDIEEAEELTKGLIHILPKLAEKGWVWSKFDNITTSIKNN